MGDKELICIINLFDAKAQIIDLNEERSYLEIKEVPKSALAYCKTANCKLHLFGNSEYISKLVTEVRELENQLYSNSNKIRIEVN